MPAPSFVGRVRFVHIAALAACFASAVRPAGAQGKDASPPAAFSNVYLTVGTLLMDASKLNPHFERTDLDPASRPGFYTLSDDAFAAGIGGYGVIKNRIGIGGEWNFADIGSESSPSGKTNQMTTTYAMATAGYAVYTSWRLNVMPYLGVGVGTAKLTLLSRDGGSSVPGSQDPTFDEVIESPGAKSVMNGSYVIVQPGIAVDLLLVGDTKSTNGFSVGFRFGTSLSPNRTTWTYQGRTVFGGPDFGPSGGVVRIVAGYGGFRLAGR
jgi:hypothetical protein